MITTVSGVNRRAGALALAAGVALAAGASAQAETVQMTFESLAHGGNTLVTHGTTYEEAGFRLELSSGEFGTWGSAAAAYPGSTALVVPSSGSVVTLTAVGGGTFDLLSMQIAKRDTAGSIFPVNVTFTGTKSDLSTVTVTFNGTVPGVFLQDFNFPATFTDLLQVQWQGTQAHQVDNITLIPAPSAAAALALAAGGLARRRRR